MKSSDKNVDSMAGTVVRKRRRDPRRSPGLFFLHVLLIVLLLAVATATVAVRSVSGRAKGGTGTVALPGDRRGAIAAEASLGPLSGPPSRPVALDADLKAKGYEVPENANVYAVRVLEGPEGRVYEQFEAGGGALAGDFWPASSIKVLAALGALDFARSLGFTGAATVAFDDGLASQTLRSIYEPAIRDSSNYDYDLLVRIAGVDHLNDVFLTARNGFPVTSISRSYGGLPFDQSPAMVFEEGGRRAYVPVRKSERTPECEGNCSNLFEMAESVRRIVLHDEIPVEQRFQLDPTDVKALAGALLKAEGFFPPAVSKALGAGAKIWSKPGDAAELDCLDVAFIQSRTGRRFLVAASVPHSEGGCETLARLARGVLERLAR
ncbi:MAG TPA: hypothetical protein VFK43_22205 [Acidimicrobiales bacterium]|nr:hypothetical protein [Acidimicrobiales bacterium]